MLIGHIPPKRSLCPTKGSVRFGKLDKLSPRYVDPFKVLDQVGVVADKLALLPIFSAMHFMFHVSLLRRYVANQSHHISYEEGRSAPTCHKRRRSCGSRIVVQRCFVGSMANILCSRCGIEEATWESEDDMMQRFPGMFAPAVVLGSLCSFLMPCFWLAGLFLLLLLLCASGGCFSLRLIFGNDIFLSGSGCKTWPTVQYFHTGLAFGSTLLSCSRFRSISWH